MAKPFCSAVTCGGTVERVTGIEPVLSAWEQRNNRPAWARPISHSTADLPVRFSRIPAHPSIGRLIPDRSPTGSPARAPPVPCRARGSRRWTGQPGACRARRDAYGMKLTVDAAHASVGDRCLTV
jgi:hypothetical protein